MVLKPNLSSFMFLFIIDFKSENFQSSNFFEGNPLSTNLKKCSLRSLVFPKVS